MSTSVDYVFDGDCSELRRSTRLPCFRSTPRFGPALALRPTWSFCSCLHAGCRFRTGLTGPAIIGVIFAVAVTLRHLREHCGVVELEQIPPDVDHAR
jgi:hypothetical protein